MKNIDFLPERYRERDLKRKAAIWQYALLLGFGGILLAATLGQWTIKHSLKNSLSELNQSRIDANLKRERVTLLKRQLGHSEEAAALYTYLRHPWPRTQLIARITESLPESVVLEGIEILEQQPDRSSSFSNEAPDPLAESASAASDLAELRGNYDAKQVVIRIRGTVDDTAALNEYVRQLGTVALFRSVSLSELQSQVWQDEMTRSVFELNVMVRPGHGQPGGPHGPLHSQRQRIAHGVATVARPWASGENTHALANVATMRRQPR